MPLYFSFFSGVASFPEGAPSLPLRDIPPKRQLKSQTNTKKTDYFLTNHQSRKIKLFRNSNISTYYNFIFTVQFTFVQFHLSPKQTIELSKLQQLIIL